MQVLDATFEFYLANELSKNILLLCKKVFNMRSQLAWVVFK